MSAPELPILVKCGGFSTHLASYVGEPVDGHPLWGSRFDAKNPTAVVQTHLDFLQNGAQIILSNTYQASVEGFMKYLDLSESESKELMQRSVRHAKEARDKYSQLVELGKGILEVGLPLVLASIGPYGAFLHDGSEYNGSYAQRMSKEELQKWHKPRIEAVLAEGVDGLAVETIPCRIEAVALVELLLADYTDVKFWVSFQCKDEQSLAHGDRFDETVVDIWQQIRQQNAESRLFAIGVNCVHPKVVTPLFQSVQTLCTEASLPLPPLVVYSNRGEVYDATAGEWTGYEDCVPLESYVPEWVELGAKIIGGCCRVYPNDILKIRKCVDNIGNNN